MEAIASLDAGYWGVQVRYLAEQLQLNSNEVLKEQSKLFFKQIMNLTPPHSRSEGRIRTRADIAKVVQPFNVKAYKSKRLEEICNQRDYRSFEAFMRNVENPNLRGAAAGPFSPDMHQRMRDLRGRIRAKRSRKFFVLGPDVKLLRKYTKRKLSHVGLAKSGWLLAYWALGGSLASWITNQEQRGQSNVENKLDDPDDPYIIGQNSTPWANDRDEGNRIVRQAAGYRVNSMETYIKKALKRAAEAAGLEVKAA